MVSGVINRGDDLNGKANALNETLKASCLSRNIGFIEHSNINLQDLNGSRLHLNKSGDNKISKNFREFIEKA